MVWICLISVFSKLGLSIFFQYNLQNIENLKSVLIKLSQNVSLQIIAKSLINWPSNKKVYYCTSTFCSITSTLCLVHTLVLYYTPSSSSAHSVQYLYAAISAILCIFRIYATQNIVYLYTRHSTILGFLPSVSTLHRVQHLYAYNSTIAPRRIYTICTAWNCRERSHPTDVIDCMTKIQKPSMCCVMCIFLEEGNHYDICIDPVFSKQKTTLYDFVYL